MNTVKNYLQVLQERRLAELEGKKDEVKRRYREIIPPAVERTATLLGVPQDYLVLACIRATKNYATIEWQLAMDIVHSVMLELQRLQHPEEKEK